MKIEFQTICKIDGISLKIPDYSFIKASDGTHFFIGQKDISAPFWQIEEPPFATRLAYCALGVAVFLVRNPETDDFWANIQWSARPGFDAGVNVFGRNICSPLWGKPIPAYLSPIKYNVPVGYFDSVKKNCGKFLDSWMAGGDKIVLFPKGVAHFSQDKEEYKEAEKIFVADKPDSKKKDIIWVNEKFIATVPRSPHLTGFHFQVFPRLKYWEPKGGFGNPWQLPNDFSSKQARSQIQGYLEMTAILFGIARILSGKTDCGFYNPEIHFSGNWAKELPRNAQENEIFSDICKRPKNIYAREDAGTIAEAQKKVFWLERLKNMKSVGHGHLYATFSRDKYVKLPSRPKEEVPGEWADISPLPLKKVEELKQIIRAELSACLKNLEGYNLSL